MKHFILGSICGDIIGSYYESRNTHSKDFPLIMPESRFTDDTILTVATMDCLLNKGDYAQYYKDYTRKYFGNRGFGSKFIAWVMTNNSQPYNSCGNGSAMRVSPIGWIYDTLEETLEEAKRSAEVTHNHPEGIKGAQAIAAAIYMARTGKSKKEIKEYITSTFDYNLNRTTDEIRPDNIYNMTCQGSVPEAIISFLESSGYENAIRLAVSIGGDSDTIACMAGGIAEAFYKDIPQEITECIFPILPQQMIGVIDEFGLKYFDRIHP